MEEKKGAYEKSRGKDNYINKNTYYNKVDYSDGTSVNDTFDVQVHDERKSTATPRNPTNTKPKK